MRIVSLLPSTTEIICELGLEHQLVGRSHECRQSEYIRSLPFITSPEIKTDRGSQDIHSDVQSLVENGLSVYKIDANTLERVNPDLIITQDHCEVCAASLQDVKQAVQFCCSTATEVLSVSPETLDDVLESIMTVGEAAGVKERASRLIGELQLRFNIIRQTTQRSSPKKIVTIEWMEPLMTGGNWIPELVDIAGGEPCLAEPGEHSPVIDWEKILDTDPDKLLIAPCGYSIQQTKNEMHLLTSRKGWQDLKAVKNGEVYILDGDRYFNRPGPGIFDSARILAEINHPDQFKPLYQNDGWIRWK